MLTGLFMFLMVMTGLFMILLVLIQRGKGGGLVGALGGMGGSSRLGVKATDAFTWVTMVSAGVWILTCIITLKLVSSDTGPINTNIGGGPPALVNTDDGGEGDTAGEGDSASEGDQAE